MAMYKEFFDVAAGLFCLKIAGLLAPGRNDHLGIN
jgi:hypothetical protein